MKVHEAYKEKMVAQLKEWDAQIKLFDAKVAKAGADMKVRHAEEIVALRSKQRMASEKMKELEKATGEAWDQTKETADKIWDDLKAGIAAANSKFK